jgi:arsenite oxidase small subunit
MGSVQDEDGRRQKGTPPESDGPETRKENPRRQFLKLSLGLGVILAAGGIASVILSLFSPSTPEPSPPPPATVTVIKTVTGTGTSTTESSSSAVASPFPRVKVANISGLTGGKAVVFNYPLQETPNILAKLGEKAEGGVGPNGDIVAFSTLCQHLGCVVGFVPTGGSPLCNSGYKAAGPVGYCCCHGSVYDFANGASVISPPAPRPLPQVTLEFDTPTGDIYAIGMSPPTIFGHSTGSNNVLNDLIGGTPVS